MIPLPALCSLESGKESDGSGNDEEDSTPKSGSEKVEKPNFVKGRPKSVVESSCHDNNLTKRLVIILIVII